MGSLIKKHEVCYTLFYVMETTANDCQPPTEGKWETAFLETVIVPTNFKG